jgi:DNA-binding transcriptional regulator LsrR (DeoR family)
MDAGFHLIDVHVHAEPGAAMSQDALARTFPKLAERIEALMKRKGLDLTALVKKTKLSRPTVQRLIRSQGNPLLLNYAKLAEALGTSVPSLLGPQEGQRDSKRKPDLLGALLARPPEGDPRALEIYEAACRLTPDEELAERVKALHYDDPGESAADSVIRAILDVYWLHAVHMDHELLPRDEPLEKQLHAKLGMPERPEVSDHHAIRVVNLPKDMHPIIQIHALAAVAAAIIRELLRTFSVLGFSDGFAVSAIIAHLRRSEIRKAVLVPLTHTPRFIHYELSGATLVGAMGRVHASYQVQSSIELSELRKRLSEVQVAVTSCGSVIKPEPMSRLARLLIAARTRSYEAIVKDLQRRKVIGDLLYHFLRADGQIVQLGETTRYLEKAELEALYQDLPEKSVPPVYSLSLDGLADIAQRGVCLLLVHSEERARVAHAALKRERRPINFIVTSSAGAQELLRLGPP